MLSKVLRSSAHAPLQAVRWRPGTPAGIMSNSAAPVTALNAQMRQGSTAPSAIAEEETQLLHARVLELETSLERQLQEARRQGFQEGEASGRNKAEHQVEPVLERLAHSIEEIRSLKSKLRDEAEADLLQLALAIARKVLHRELNTDPECVAGLIRVALERMNSRDMVKIRVHPAHQALLQTNLAQLHPGSDVEIVPDPRLEAGSLIIETIRGEFDASVNSNLKEIESGLTDQLRRS